MASIQVTALVRHVGNAEDHGINKVNFTTTGNGIDAGTVNVGTVEESLTFRSDVATANYLILVNEDATNYVEVGFATTVYVIRLLASQAAVLPITPTNTTLYWKADTAACEVRFWVIEP